MISTAGLHIRRLKSELWSLFIWRTIFRNSWLWNQWLVWLKDACRQTMMSRGKTFSFISNMSEMAFTHGWIPFSVLAPGWQVSDFCIIPWKKICQKHPRWCHMEKTFVKWLRLQIICHVNDAPKDPVGGASAKVCSLLRAKPWNDMEKIKMKKT